MKKTLVLAMAMALGVSATALAANPFSDLPAGHWAYASVAKLAAAGVVDGYPDGSFKGEKTMTRYEMAQIVAKALAKGAIASDDKLIGEFADELDNLGVRVAKLEKQADKVKITGNFRASYGNDHVKGKYGTISKKYKAAFRSRLFFTGEVNDDWNYVAMLQNRQKFAKSGLGEVEDGDSGTNFQRAYLTGNLGEAVKLTLGRFPESISGGNAYDSKVDGIKAEIGKDIKFTAEYGKMASHDENTFKVAAGKSAADKFYRLSIDGKLGGLGLGASYLKANKVQEMGMAGTDDKIWSIGADYTLGEFNVGAMYLKGSNEIVEKAGGSQKGWVAQMSYGDATPDKVGSAGIYAKYYNQGASTTIAHTMGGAYDEFPWEGFKGFMVGANYTLLKNVVATFEYYDLKGKESDKKAKTLWSELLFSF